MLWSERLNLRGLRMYKGIQVSFQSAPASASARPRLCLVALACTLLLASACGHKTRQTAKLPPPPSLPSTTAPSTASKLPPPSVADVDPHAKAIWSQTGYASWYGPPYHNRPGANGEIYDQDALTAAHRTLPMNSIVRVVNLKTSHEVVVRITDRGPFVDDRIIDLSKAAAKAVDVWRPGTAPVRLDVLRTPAPIDEGGRWCVQVGAFKEQGEALKLKERLQRRYHTAKVLQFPGPTGYWVRVRVLDDDKARAQEVSKVIKVDEGGVFLVRLD